MGVSRVVRTIAWLLLAMALPTWAQTVAPAPAPAPAPARELRVLFVGNSLTYVNNLPRLLHAMAASQPGRPAITTMTYAAPGGTVAERWADGHAAAALRDGHWDVLVLQERGGLLACLVDSERRQESECRASERAHRDFAELAGSRGSRVLLLATWGPDGDWQRRLDEAIRKLSGKLRSGGADVAVVPAGSTLRAWARRQPADAPAFPDGVHPGLPASLVMAAQLYRAVAGEDAQPHDLAIDFPLLPANALVKPGAPLESQAQLAGDGHGLLLKADALAPLLEAARDSR
jgi:hypothetical protein